MLNETIKSIMSRRSIRAYKTDTIPDDIMKSIIEAGQAAPYIMPDSRHFSVIQDREIISRINITSIAEGSKISEYHRQLFSVPGFDGTYGAPVVIVLSGKEDSVQYETVCGASIQNMLIAAQSLGIASCWAYFPIFIFHGEENERWRNELRILEGFQPCGAVLLGYSMEESSMNQNERYINDVTYIGG
jgi:nitroreductase